jgi:hypothetical protein
MGAATVVVGVRTNRRLQTMQRPHTTRLLGMALLAAATFTASGCLIQSSSSTSYAGNRVTGKTLARLEKGVSNEEYVLATIGVADEEQELSDGTILWKYSWSEKRQHSGAVFLLFGGESSTSRQGKAFIRFEDGVVQDYWID